MRLGLGFLWFGLFWGSFAVVTFDLEHFLHLGDAGFGALLTAAVAAGIVSNLTGGALTKRLGARRALVGAIALWSLFELGLAAMPVPVVFAGLFVVGVAVSGLVDLGINVAGTARYGGDPGRLAQVNALFNAGALLGAAVAASLLATGQSWRWAWGAFGVAGLALALATSSDAAPEAPAGEGVTSPALLWRRHLLVLAAAFALAALVEGGLDTWGVLYLRAHLGLTALAGGAGYVAGQALAAAARVWLGPRAGRLGGALGAALGAGLAAAGLAIEALGPGPVAVLGLAIAILGISLCWPLLMAAAGRSGANLPAVVGALVAVGYLGFLVGPSAVGWISGAVGLRMGILVLAAAAAFSASTAVLEGRRARLT